MALAVLVLPFPLPLTWVEVYRPVTSEVSTKRSATFEVLIVVDMMLCQTPVGMVCEPCAIHGAILLEFAQTVTVVICAVAFELCAETKLEQQSKAAAVRLMSSFFMGGLQFGFCVLGLKWLERSLGWATPGAQITKDTGHGTEMDKEWSAD